MIKKNDAFKKVKNPKFDDIFNAHQRDYSYFVTDVDGKEAVTSVYYKDRCVETNNRILVSDLQDSNQYELVDEIYFPLTLVIDNVMKTVKFADKVYKSQSEAEAVHGKGKCVWCPELIMNGYVRVCSKEFVKSYKGWVK